MIESKKKINYIKNISKLSLGLNIFSVLINIGLFYFDLFKILLWFWSLFLLFGFQFLVSSVINFSLYKHFRMCLIFTNIRNFIFILINIF